MNNVLNARGAKLSLLLGGLFWLALTSLLFFEAVEPIGDPDFWWHLKTGETMIQEGGLLQSDPFTFQSNGETSTREASILKGSWLWEISAYSLYKHLNLNGILVLKFLTISAIAAALALQIRRQRIILGIAAPLLIAGFLLLGPYALERPQIFSFFFAIPLVGMLSSVRQGGRLGLSLPIVMCLWANVHGGVVVGNLILLCFAAGVAIEYRRDLSRMKHLLLWTIAGVAASLINPSGNNNIWEIPPYNSFSHNYLYTFGENFQKKIKKIPRPQNSLLARPPLRNCRLLNSRRIQLPAQLSHKRRPIWSLILRN